MFPNIENLVIGIGAPGTEGDATRQPTNVASDPRARRTAIGSLRPTLDQILPDAQALLCTCATVPYDGEVTESMLGTEGDSDGLKSGRIYIVASLAESEAVMYYDWNTV